MKLRFFALILLLALPVRAHAREIDRVERMKSLAINRALLAAFEAEYTDKLKEKGVGPPSKKREMANLKYKIEALSEESSRLASPLSEKERADEFLKDVVVKKQAVAAPALSGVKSAPSVENLERVPALHDQALKLVAARKLRDAAKIYEEITLIDPDDDQAYLIMGHCYLLTGEFERAETAFQNAVHIDPANVGEITPFYENMILNDPDDDMAYSQLGYAHLILGNLEKAKSAFEDALTINPDNPLAMSGYRIVQTASEPPPPAQ